MFRTRRRLAQLEERIARLEAAPEIDYTLPPVPPPVAIPGHETPLEWAPPDTGGVSLWEDEDGSDAGTWHTGVYL